MSWLKLICWHLTGRSRVNGYTCTHVSAIGLRMDREVLRVAVGLCLVIAVCRPGTEVDHCTVAGGVRVGTQDMQQ